MPSTTFAEPCSGADCAFCNVPRAPLCGLCRADDGYRTSEHPLLADVPVCVGCDARLSRPLTIRLDHARHQADLTALADLGLSTRWLPF